MRQDDLWMFKYELLKAYCEEYETTEIEREFKTFDGITYDSDGFALGYWLYDQRKNNISGELLDERRKLLEELGVDLSLSFVRESLWSEKYNLLKAYYEKYKTSEVLYRFKTFDGITYDENGIKLGRWVHNQRRKKPVLSPERIKLLKEVDFRFNSTNNEYVWEKNYLLAKNYYNVHKNLEVPMSFKTKNGIDYDPDGKRLRQWLDSQIFLYRSGSLSKKRYTLLKKLGLVFDQTKLEYNWNRMYKLACAYYKEHKDLEVSATFKTKDGYTYDEDGLNLGYWIKNQRMFYYNNVLSRERFELLEKIGMRFNCSKRDIDWNKMYDLVKAYYEKNNDLDINSKFRTEDGVTYNKNGSYLKMWINAQIKLYKAGKLSEDKIKKLKEINVPLDGEIITNEQRLENVWMEMYKLACNYYECHRHLEITRSFRTDDGYTFAANGKKLGTWISSQRYALYDNKLSADRKSKLDSIGMIWNVKKNSNEIKDICLEYGIDYEINKDILLHISPQELICKIKYLNEIGIPIEVNGFLHQIFSMSNINMSVIYGVTLEDLIETYNQNNSLKKVKKS